MFCINNTKRLISINLPAKDENTAPKVCKLMPGAGPEEVEKEFTDTDFYVHLVDAGDIAEVGEKQPQAKAAKAKEE